MEKSSQVFGKKSDKDFIALRGLTARVIWAEAIGLHCEESHVLGMGYAEMRAFLQGYEDFNGGRDPEDVPPLLADVPALADQWKQGWLRAQVVELEKLPLCHTCNGSGFIHGNAA
jgi:hypothetical protein